MICWWDMRLWLRVALFGFVSAVIGWMQTAPTIEVGTKQDVVIRTYGWPKGRSAANERESWVYDQFQIMFENGRVVNVVPLPPSKNQPKAKQVPVVISPSSQKVGSAPSTVSPKRPSPAPSDPAPSNIARSPSSKPAPPLVKEVPRVLAQKEPWWRLPAWIWLSLFLPMILLAAYFSRVEREWWALLLRRRAPAPIPASPSSPVPMQRSWQDEVAERLSKTVPPTSRATELTVGTLRELEWKRFEQIVALYYAATGMRAEGAGVGPDGGIDVKLFRTGEARPFCYVQCKAWASDKVGVVEMRNLLGALANDRVTAGVFATTSDFWPDARAFAANNNIEVLTAGDFVTRFNQLPEEARRRILTEVMAGDYTTPSCPSCGTKMTWKAEHSFWGCPRFRVCRSKPIHGRKAAV
jgi:endogenous inhibitor of DNA gyrase (YacG/DUF329 family)